MAMKTASLQLSFGNTHHSSSFVCVYFHNSTLKTSISPNQLGVTGPDKAKMADNFIPTLVEGKAVTGGRWRWESTPKIHSDFDFAMNEEYSYTWAGETYKEIATYKPDMTGMLLATRGPHGHVIKSDMTFTKNFLVNVFEIEGLTNSRATVIFTRA